MWDLDTRFGYVYMSPPEPHCKATLGLAIPVMPRIPQIQPHNFIMPPSALGNLANLMPLMPRRHRIEGSVENLSGKRGMAVILQLPQTLHFVAR